MERIVYLLGAGFSAPLGLPIMSDFYFKSQDMFMAEPDKYSHFKEVFDTIRDMSHYQELLRCKSIQPRLGILGAFAGAIPSAPRVLKEEVPAVVRAPRAVDRIKQLAVSVARKVQRYARCASAARVPVTTLLVVLAKLS